MNAHSRCTCLLALALFANGCARTDVAPPEARIDVRDSAGVEIVDNTQPDRALTLSPLLRVGVVDGNPDLQFDRIRTVALDDAGGFWVVDGNPSIRHYDANGRLVGRAGAEGQGPGEARSYGNVWTAGGEVLARGNPSILQRFAADGTFIDSQTAVSDGGALISRSVIRPGSGSCSSSGIRPTRRASFAGPPASSRRRG